VEGAGPCVAPAAPAGLAATFNVGGVVSLTWNGPTVSPTTYVIEAGSLPGITNLANSDLGGPGTSMTTTGVAPGTYYVRVRARNACGISAPSNEIVVVVRPATPFPTQPPPPPPTCTVTLSPTGYSGGGSDAGGAGIRVSSPVGCAWTATSNVPWITILQVVNTTGGAQGIVQFGFTANTTGASRTGTLTIGGQTFTFQQNGFSCNQDNASLSPTRASFTAAGGTGSIAVTYTAGCAWDVLPIIEPAAAWVTIASPGVRTGSSMVTYTVAPNPGGSRILFVGFVSKVFEIYQEGR
jgi:hypothetical protein